MYQEGYTFCKDDLLKQWMAEGFIDITEGDDVEKVAETYLRQLIGRRFIQPILNYNNEVLSCAVHDVVHDLIARKSAEENFIVAIDYSQNNVELSHKARRLSLLFGDARYAKTPANIIKSQVRSLRFLGSFEGMPSIIDFKLLRVLNLQLSSHDGDVDLTGVSELSQLRYLKIACDCHSIVLPYHGLLETLDVMGAVDIDYRWSRDILFPRLLRLSLPFKGMLMYWSSRHRSLQGLHLSPTTHDLGRSIQGLHFLINRHVNLKTIVMGHGSRVGNMEVVSLDELAPPPFLQRFEWPPESGIAFHRIPKWFKELENLSILKIAVWELMNCVDILRGLHALTALSLYVQRAPVERVVFDKVGFSVLKYFKLRFTTGIAWIKFEKDAMPNLWKLKLVFNEIPRMDVPPFFTSKHTSRTEKYKHGTPLIIFEHMPDLKGISAKIGGAAADVDYIWRSGISNDLSNPSIINTQPAADYSFDSEESTKQKHQQDEIMEEEPDEYYKQQLDEAPQDEPDGSYKQQPDNTVERPVDKRSAKPLRVFTWEELMSATCNFSEENHLDGTTYKGTVDGELMVNVTKFTSEFDSWLWQARYLEEMRNPHVLRLLGYCYEHKILVYEHMPRGSLKDRLEFDLVSPLPWLTRLKIAVGAADGLAFLHETCLQKIYTHFTASSIMLALDYTAKLWGFGLAEEDDFWVSESARKKSDVYDFGVVLLELLAGRPAVINRATLRQKRNLVEWSRPYLRHKGKLHLIMDPSLEGKYSLSAAWSTAKVVRRCINRVPEERPTMRGVVEALEPLLKDGRHSRAAWWTPSSLLTRYGAVKGRSKAKQAQEEVDEPTPAASSLTLPAH
ncbi:hypothetical protein ACQJBY_061868 [Aegilops geniculata]